MRSLPIAKAFLKPFASNCKGSSTLGFVRLVTESDWRRPRSVGVRQELVRVSVRAVDMWSCFFGSLPSAASGVSGGPSLCSGAQVGPKSYVLAFRLASVGSERTAVVWFVLPAVPRSRLPAGRERFATETLSFWASSMAGCSQHSPQLIAEASPTTTAALIRRQNPPA